MLRLEEELVGVLLLTRLVLPEVRVVPELRLPPELEVLRTVPEELRLPPEVLRLAAVVPEALRLPPLETVRSLLELVVAAVPVLVERLPPSLRTLLLPEAVPFLGVGVLRPP